MWPLEIPEEIKEAEKIYKPYMKGAKLVNPTPEAKEAFEKVKKYYWSLEQ